MTLTHCPNCAYSLEGLPADYVCPECGFACDRRVFVKAFRLPAGAAVVFILATAFLGVTNVLRGIEAGHSFERRVVLLGMGGLYLLASGAYYVQRRYGMFRLSIGPEGVHRRRFWSRDQLWRWDEFDDVRARSAWGSWSVELLSAGRRKFRITSGFWDRASAEGLASEIRDRMEHYAKRRGDRAKSEPAE